MTHKPIALITGISGQDGGYLAEYLLTLDYYVVGMKRRSSTRNQDVLDKLLEHPDFDIVEGDMSDAISLRDVLGRVKPDEIYNLAAQSFVGTSWRSPGLTSTVNFIGVLNLLEAARDMGMLKPRIYQASTSEMFGNQSPPQNEKTSMTPRSPYGVSKLAAHSICRVYRESFGMFITCGILFNHESPRRGPEFVSRKIANSVVRVVMGKQDFITLGDLSAKRDFGYAPDYVRAMWLMMQQEEPDDFVIATGRTHSVKGFVTEAFDRVRTSDKQSWERFIGNREYGIPVEFDDIAQYIKQDEKFMRPAEVYQLCGDYTKAKRELNWEPTHDFHDLVEIMVNAEIEKERS